jgi:hypothetical protein
MTTFTATRRTVLAVAASAALLTGTAAFAAPTFAAASPAGSHGASPNGWVPLEQGTSLAAKDSLQPGLRKKAHAESGVLSGTLDGCNFEGQGQAGQGSLTIVFSGTASLNAASLTGTFTANWPASSGLNPSNGTITISSGTRGSYSLSGTVTSGAFTGEPFQGAYVVTGMTGTGRKHDPVTAQTIVNTAPIETLENIG